MLILGTDSCFNEIHTMFEFSKTIFKETMPCGEHLTQAKRQFIQSIIYVRDQNLLFRAICS